MQSHSDPLTFYLYSTLPSIVSECFDRHLADQMELKKAIFVNNFKNGRRQQLKKTNLDFFVVLFRFLMQSSL